MRHPFMQRTKPISPEEMREVYGVPATQVRSCEDAFRKASNRRRQQLMAAVGAIDLEKKRAERTWNCIKSRFAREHAELVRASRKIVYHKLGTVSKLREEAVPPCIPFLGHFPPTRHPTKARRVSEMFKEPLFSRSALQDTKPGGGTEAEEEEGEEVEEDRKGKDDDFAFYLATRRVSSSFSSANLDPSKFADIVERNFHHTRNRSSSLISDKGTGQLRSGSLGSTSVDPVKNADVGDHRSRNRSSSQILDNGAGPRGSGSVSSASVDPVKNGNVADKHVHHPTRSASHLSVNRTSRRGLGSFNSALVYPSELTEISTAGRERHCNSSASHVTTDAEFHERQRRRSSVEDHRGTTANTTSHTTTHKSFQHESAGSQLPDRGNSLSRVSTCSQSKAKTPSPETAEKIRKGKDSERTTASGHNNQHRNRKGSQKTSSAAGVNDYRGNDTTDGIEPKTRSSPPSRGKTGAVRQDTQGTASKQTSGEGTPGKSNLTPRSDQTSVSLDVELLQRALKEHSSQNLSRSRWHAHRDVGRMHLMGHEAEDGAAVAGHTLGSSKSLSSVSTPSTRSATDISDIQSDINMVVVRIIMKLFQELDDPQLCTIEEVWPPKMRNLKVEIEQLVRNTCVDITEILEKIQRGDVQDETSAALLDWVRNCDSCAPPEDETTFISSPVSRRMSAQCAGPIVSNYDETSRARRKSNESLGYNSLGFAKAHNNHPRWSNSTSVKEMPVMKVDPPSRRQSQVFESDNRTRRASKESNLNPLTALGTRRSRSSSDPNRPNASLLTTRRHSSYSSTVCAHRYQTGNPAVSPRAWLRQSPYTGNDVALFCQSGDPDASQQLHRGHSPYTSNDAAILYQIRKNSVSRNTSCLDGSATEDQTEITTVSDLKCLGANPSSSEPLPSAKRLSDASDDSHSKPPLYVQSPPASLVDHKHSASAASVTAKRNDSPSITMLPPVSASASSPRGSTSPLKEPENSYKGYGHQQQPSQHRHSTNPGRKVSFPYLNDCSDGETDTRQRSASKFNSFSRSESVESQNNLHSGTFRPRVFSTGQQYPLRTAPWRNPSEDPRSRSLSPSFCRQRVDSVKSEGDPISFSVTPAFDEDVPAEVKERHETTQVVTHTDRYGRVRRLSMQKVSLANASSREANFIFTREDTLMSQEEATNQTNNDKTTQAEDENRIVHDELPNDEVFRGSQNEAPNDDTLLSPRNHHGNETSTADGKPDDGSTQDKASKATQEDGQDQNDEIGNEDAEKILWRRRLTRPAGRMSWIEELSHDYKAQGLALSMLHRKQGSGPTFRSTVLSVICVNAMMAAKSVYDDDAYREVKKCRYLRMPSTYMADVEGELSVKEIFS